MNSKIDNPPAFPDSVAVNAVGDVSWSSTDGMSLRDWFAGQLLGNSHFLDEHGVSAMDHFAQSCYEVADEMLKARKHDASE